MSFTNYQSQNVLNNENVLLENTIIEISPEIIFLPNYGLDSKNSYLNSLEIKTNIPIYATYKFKISLNSITVLLLRKPCWFHL